MQVDPYGEPATPLVPVAAVEQVAPVVSDAVESPLTNPL